MVGEDGRGGSAACWPECGACALQIWSPGLSGSCERLSLVETCGSGRPGGQGQSHGAGPGDEGEGLLGWRAGGTSSKQGRTEKRIIYSNNIHVAKNQENILLCATKKSTLKS